MNGQKRKGYLSSSFEKKTKEIKQNSFLAILLAIKG